MRIWKLLIMLVVIALLWEFAFIKYHYWEDFKANLDWGSFLDDLIDEPDPSRSFAPTLTFLPEWMIHYDKCDDWWDNCEYYVLNTPDDVIEIWVDNVTSNPHCDYWWRYKFQWYSKYFKIWEWITDADISSANANYPVLKQQEWTNKNYKIDWNKITVYFDKDIAIAQFHNFTLKNNIKVYSDYTATVWGEATIDSVSIPGTGKSTLEIILFPAAYRYKPDDGRIVIRWNVIADKDWRIAPNDIIVWTKVLWDDLIPRYVIDNNTPTCTSVNWNTGASTQLTVFFNENIYEVSGVSLMEKITGGFPALDFTDINIEWNQLQLFFSSSNLTWWVTIGEWAVQDKVWNKNTQITCP